MVCFPDFRENAGKRKDPPVLMAGLLLYEETGESANLHEGILVKERRGMIALVLVMDPFFA